MYEGHENKRLVDYKNFIAAVLAGDEHAVFTALKEYLPPVKILNLALLEVAKKKTEDFTNNHFTIMELLIAKGADVNATDNRKCTPLHLAASTGNAELVQFLLDNKADITALDNGGRSAFKYAANNHYPKLANYLYDVMSAKNKNKAQKSCIEKVSARISHIANALLGTNLETNEQSYNSPRTSGELMKQFGIHPDVPEDLKRAVVSSYQSNDHDQNQQNLQTLSITKPKL